MMNGAEVDKVLLIRAAEPRVMSLFLTVPLDLAALRGLPAKADGLLAAAARANRDGHGDREDHGRPASRVRQDSPESRPGHASRPGPASQQSHASPRSRPVSDRALTADRQAVRELLDEHVRDWLGHTLAIFMCGDIGLSEWTVLPGDPPEQAVLADRPHVRPLLVALQRHPAYLAAVIDRRHAWVFRVTPDRALSTEDHCPEGDSAARAAPDLIEELVAATLGEGGQVKAVEDPPAGIAARLRFPLASGDER